MRRSGRVRRLRRFVGLALLAGLAVLLSPAAPASAHAYLTSSSPSDGSSVDAAPRRLTLHFSESVSIASTRIDVVSGSGRHIPVTALRISTGESTEDPSVVEADLPALPRGAYRVNWQTLSSDDLHRTSGVFVFGVAARVAATPFHEPVPRVEEAALRWLLFLGFAGSVGGLVGAGLVRRGGGLSRRRCLDVAAVCGGVALLTAVGLLVDQAVTDGEPLGRLLSSTYGLRWGARELGLALLVVAALAGRRPTARRAAAGLGAVGAVAAGTGAALLGHSATGAGVAVTRIGADAAHLIAAAVWTGLLGVGVAAAVSARRSGGERPARTVLLGFAGPAAACVSVMIVTGIYLSSGVVGSVDAAVLTIYGRVLLLKVVLFGGAALLGLANHRRLRRPGAALPGRTLLAEGTLLVLALGSAAVLTSGQPAREPEFVAAPRLATVPLVDGRAGDLQETVRLGPNQVGRSVAVVEVLDTRRPAPAPIAGVTVRFVDADGRAGRLVGATRIGTGRQWSAPVQIALPGRSTVEVTVSRPGLPAVTGRFAWVVGAAPQHRRAVTVSDAPIGAELRAMSLVVAALLALAWSGAAVARRRRAPAEPELVVSSGDWVREAAGSRR